MKPLPDPFTQPAQLRHAREQHGLSQSDLAALLGMTRQQVNLMESGTAAIQRRTGLHAALLFTYLEQTEAKRVGRPATDKPHARATMYNNYKPADVNSDAKTRRADVEAMPPGTLYMAQWGKTLYTMCSWTMMERGEGSVYDDLASSVAPPNSIPWELSSE